jgi:hypothetical protein
VAAEDYLAQVGRPLAPEEEPFAALANFVVAERVSSDAGHRYPDAAKIEPDAGQIDQRLGGGSH